MNKFKKLAAPVAGIALVAAGLASAAATDPIPNPLPNAVAGNVIKASDINDLATAVGILDERTVGLTNHEQVVVYENGDVTIGSIAQLGKLSIPQGKGSANWAQANQNTEADLKIGTRNVDQITSSFAMELPTHSTTYGASFAIDGDYSSNVTTANIRARGVKFLGWGSSLAFHTTNGDNELERMRINLHGQVGIGTDNPKSKLHVVGLANYADNAAAIAAGLTVGAFYHTAGDLKVVY